MKNPVIALIGNPNVGKTSLFNRITKLNHKVGNYPGVTVEKRSGTIKHGEQQFNIVDLPGTYSIFPTSLDEEIVYNTLSEDKNPLRPDLVIVVSEPSTLKRAIVLYQQVREMGLPAFFVINMMDETEKKGITIDIAQLEQYLKTKVFLTNSRTGEGVKTLISHFEARPQPYFGSFPLPDDALGAMDDAKKLFPLSTTYKTWQIIAQDEVSYLSREQKEAVKAIQEKHNLIPQELQKQEALIRGNLIQVALTSMVKKQENRMLKQTKVIDELLLHPVLGYIVFFGLLMLIFQAIFAWSGPFMDIIDSMFGDMAGFLHEKLPEGPLSSLFIDGIVTGIGGIVIFLPQIVILFVFLSLMEESGYMSRVVFLMDRWLKPFGLNGKSVIPLMSGAACAIPAVMSARNIENPKERLLTILVTPFMTCSARLPIYIVIIALVIPEGEFMGLNYQGLALFAMYILGLVGALFSAWLLNKVIKSIRSSYLIFELPTYKMPDWKNVGINVWEKSMGFLIDAGKIILAMAIVLWVLGNFGPNDKFSNAEQYVLEAHPMLSEDELGEEIAAYKLEHSFLGYMGRGIEPVIAPLGYDWKMGIGLISSFAAREVFVATMAVVYSLGDEVDIEDDEQKSTLLGRMRSEINRLTGQPAYHLASGISLLLFYAFAMQCMATIAIVRKETGSWKWTLIQLVFMTGLAYLVALIAYQTLK